MSKRSNRHDMSSVGGRLRKYREMAGYTQKALADELHTTRQLVAAWENGTRESYLQYMPEICKELNVDEAYILYGVKEENQTIHAELGLSDDAINYLKQLNNRQLDYQTSFVETAEEMAPDIGKLKIPLDTPIIEGGTPAEVLFFLNWILSHEIGQDLLSLLSKYCTIDNSQGYVYDKTNNDIDSYPVEECDELYFRNHVGEGWTTINPAVLRYALIPAITDLLNSVRIEIQKEDE